MEDLTVITVVNHSGSFGKNFVKLKDQNETVIHQPRSVRIWKNCALRALEIIGCDLTCHRLTEE